MSNMTAIDNEIRIIPPDQSLRKKLGNASLDQILSPQAVQDAQQVIVQSSDLFLEESLNDLKNLQQAVNLAEISAVKNAQCLNNIIGFSFALKSKAGLAGYDLVSIIAKSLHARCELLNEESLSSKNFPIIKWHVESIDRLLNLKVKGLGGSIGEAILAEVNKLALAIGQSLPSV